MKLIDLAFINKFSNGNNNSTNNNEIGTLQNGPIATIELPEIEGVLSISGINENFLMQEIKINNLSLMHSREEYPLSLYSNLIASGIYIISYPIRTKYLDKIIPYIVEFEKISNRSQAIDIDGIHNILYKKITEWDEKIDILNKTEDYFQIGFTMPELNIENELLLFYVEIEEDDPDDFWYFEEGNKPK